jgi:predicted DsbA family dithiol-disulfide isomerase
VRLAHQLAVESDLVRADMVEAIEFPHLAVKYQVQGVPRTVINETAHIEGAVAEPLLMAKLKAVVR